MKRTLFALFLLICSTGLASAQESANDVIITVDSTNLRFNPSEVTVQEGQAVRFVWGGQALPHNAVESDGLFDSGEPARDVDYRFEFEVGMAGSYQFVCEPHESVGMVGLITVEAANVTVIEEVEEEEVPEKTPAVSFAASIILVAFVAVLHRPKYD
tara:strand:+ start:75 stop:545 length:471 start_codon:yes stop_codon:yes gene_type:complete